MKLNVVLFKKNSAKIHPATLLPTEEAIVREKKVALSLSMVGPIIFLKTD